VRVLGGLMALGYEIGTIMRRKTVTFKSGDDELTVKLDEIENLGDFVQVRRRAVACQGVCVCACVRVCVCTRVCMCVRARV
jgi:hypothetical protein